MSTESTFSYYKNLHSTDLSVISEHKHFASNLKTILQFQMLNPLTEVSNRPESHFSVSENRELSLTFIFPLNPNKSTQLKTAQANFTK